MSPVPGSSWLVSPAPTYSLLPPTLDTSSTLSTTSPDPALPAPPAYQPQLAPVPLDLASLLPPPGVPTPTAPNALSPAQHTAATTLTPIAPSSAQPISFTASSSQPPILVTLPANQPLTATPELTSMQALATATIQPPPATTTQPTSTQAPVLATSASITPQHTCTMTNFLTGPTAMPDPCLHNTPYFARQQNDSMADFLFNFKRIALNHNLLDVEKVNTIVQYMSSTTQQFWKTFDRFIQKDWAAFHVKLEELYHDTTNDRYSKSSLIEFAKISAQTCIRDEQDLVLYLW
ncbi:hypothetical protein BJV74DRAFT_883406 [Russula compacta]|nr:hypothetical protein BJV74DRAFT_883406 [Russula compacta]